MFDLVLEVDWPDPRLAWFVLKRLAVKFCLVVALGELCILMAVPLLAGSQRLMKLSVVLRKKTYSL